MFVFIVSASRHDISSKLSIIHKNRIQALLRQLKNSLEENTQQTEMIIKATMFDIVLNLNGDKMCVTKLNDLPSALKNLYQNVCQKLAHIERQVNNM